MAKKPKVEQAAVPAVVETTNEPDPVHSTVRTLAAAQALPEIEVGWPTTPDDDTCIVAFKDTDDRAMLVVWDGETLCKQERA